MNVEFCPVCELNEWAETTATCPYCEKEHIQFVCSCGFTENEDQSSIREDE